jgi:hypothetical protein
MVLRKRERTGFHRGVRADVRGKRAGAERAWSDPRVRPEDDGGGAPMPVPFEAAAQAVPLSFGRFPT